MKGRCIQPGRAEGEALVSEEPISFFGGVEIQTGRVIEKGHCLHGETLKDKIVVFPCGKGSTVGSYVIYGLKMNGAAPKAILNQRTETIVATGVILAEIPCVDGIDIARIHTGDWVVLDAEQGEVTIVNSTGCTP
jgi:predicted aconitase with swiveling domain